MNWMDFLDDNHIEFVTRGSNTKRGEISVQCPWCRDDDPSEHLGIGPNGWGCLRDASHRGRQPHRLVQALLGSSYLVARLTVAQYSVADPEAFTTLALAFDAASEA